MKSKKLISIILALTMLCTMFGSFTAFANDEVLTTVNISFELQDDIQFSEVSDLKVQLYRNNGSEDDLDCISYISEYQFTNGLCYQYYENEGDYYTYKAEVLDLSDEYYAQVSGTIVSGSEDAEFKITISKNTETTFNLTVNMTDENSNPIENVSYTLENNGTMVTPCYSGVAKEITANKNNDIKISFVPIYGYTTPDNITFKVGEMDSNSTLVKNEDGSYTIAVQFTANETERTHAHPICGTECDGTCVEGTHKELFWQPISDVISDSGNQTISKDGNYYLDKDYNFGANELKLDANVNIDLNGHSIKGTSSPLVYITRGKNVAITDCSENGAGLIQTNASYTPYSAIETERNGTGTTSLKIYNGTYGGTSAQVLDIYGETTTDIYGGNFSTKSSKDYIIFNDSSKPLNIYGGKFDTPDGNWQNNVSSIRTTSTTSICNVYGGTFISTDNAGGVSFSSKGILNVYDISGIQRPISLSGIYDGNAINICKKLTKPTTKIKAVWSGTSVLRDKDITKDWSKYMQGEDPNDYFDRGSYQIALNPDTDEVCLYEYGQIPYKVSVDDNIKNGTIKADLFTYYGNKENITKAVEDDKIILTATPDTDYKLSKLSVKDANGGDVEVTKTTSETGISTLSTSEEYTFTMPAMAVTITAEFKIDSPFTVKADVSKTTDKDSETDGTQVEVGDTVTVDVTVTGDDGDDFTSADWEMLYDSSKFKLLTSTFHDDAQAVTSSSNVLAGQIIAPTGDSDGDEYESGTAVATYTFEVLSQTKDNVEGIFKILSAHANNYYIAGKHDNKVASKEDGKVVIVLVKDSTDDETGATQTPAGTFSASTKAYNGYYQTGNEFTLDEKFTKATVTYAATEEGKEASELTYRTTLPSWKNVGTYTYYAKISGAGLKTTYVSTTLTITPISLKPSAKFKVDPNVKNVTFVPTLEGVVDGSHAGTVTVKYTGEDGNPVTKELNATDFRYDGESTSVYNGSEVFSTKAYESGEFVVDLEYKKADVDNYTDGTGKATINVDKITADDETVTAIENTITNTFLYDSKKHSVKIDTDKLAEINTGTWSVSTIENAYDSTEDPEVTNVGEDKLVKIVFTDSTNNYNDVTVFAILKVEPRKVTITVDDKNKVKGGTDPEFTGTIKVYDEEDNIVTEGLNKNGVYGEDNLNVTYTREDGEEVGTYTIMASYEPNDNYAVTVEEGEFEIKAPSTDKDDEDAEVKIEVVDFSGIGDGTPDYVAGKRLILVYTNLDKVYYGYGDKDNYEKFFDVTEAGYKYVKNIYTNGVHTTENDDTVYNHVYGIVVDAIDEYEATDEYENKYREKVIFLGSNSEYAPEDITYDADINLSETLDVNDYSMTNGIYNTLSVYPRATYIRSFLKADYNHDKVVNTTDANEVKSAYENK